MSTFSFLNPKAFFPLPRSFDFHRYIEIEREFWALFPETYGNRVNFCQLGLTARIFVESAEDGSELKPNETYFLMPAPDRTLRPVRMREHCRLTLSQFRMAHLTALKIVHLLDPTVPVMEDVHREILGPEVAREAGLP